MYVNASNINKIKSFLFFLSKNIIIYILHLNSTAADILMIELSLVCVCVCEREKETERNVCVRTINGQAHEIRMHFDSDIAQNKLII